MNREKFKVFEGVFDNLTINALEKLSKKYFDELIGPISTGKEANVYLASSGDGWVAVKIYRILARLYKGFDIYIRNDPRFKGISNNPRQLIYAWTKKEFKNLLRARNAGVRVPLAIGFFRNVLVMEFIGVNGVAAPTAKELPPSNPFEWRDKLFDYIKRLWINKGMVHGDLSAWNILNFNEEPVIIDISQAVLKSHPLSIKLLKRDINNITNWLKKLGVNDNSLIEWFNEVSRNEV